MLVQRTTLDPKKILFSHTEKQHGTDKTKTALNTYVCGNHPPVPGPFLPALAALCLSSSLSLSLSSRSVTAVAVLCYRKRCGPRSAATSSIPLTHTTDTFRGYLGAQKFGYIENKRLEGWCTETLYKSIFMSVILLKHNS